MNCRKISIPGAYLISKEETDNWAENVFYDYSEFSKIGIQTVFSEHFEISFELSNTFRGFYIQDAPLVQNLLFRCLHGSCSVTLLDLRKNSTAFKSHETLSLDTDADFLYIPCGVAYALLSQADDTELYCFADNTVSEPLNLVINAFDPELGCQWPEQGLIISALTRMAPKLAELPHHYW